MAVTGARDAVAAARDAVEPGGTRRPVLIGFADALAAPETAWSLSEAGTPVVAFTRRGSRPPLRRSKAIQIVEVTSPAQDAGRAVDDLRRLVRARSFQAVMPVDDAALWLCQAAVGDGETPVAGPVGAAAELALDKRLQLAAARRAGFCVPVTYEIDTPGDIGSLHPLPVVLKPARPVLERHGVLVRPKGYVCATPAELATAMERWPGGATLLAQPLLPGTGEGLFGIAGEHGLHALSAHRRIRMMNPQGSGSSACASIPVDPALVAPAARMLDEIGWRGMFMLEFLRTSDGTAWFMELNGRPWGSMALARRSGLEYPAWALAQTADSAFRPPDRPFAGEQVCRHLGRELVHLLMVLRGPQSAGLADWPSRTATVRAVFTRHRGEHWYNCRPGDRALFVEDTVATVWRQLKRAP